MPLIRITPPRENSSEFPGIAKDLVGSPGKLFRELLDGEPSVEGVLAMMQYKMYCKMTKYKTPLEFLESDDQKVIDETWDALMNMGWTLEVFP
jgi:hypothetical protein